MKGHCGQKCNLIATCIPLDRTFIPLDRTFLPLDRTFIPLDRTFLPLDRTFIPLDRTFIPLDRTFLPLDRTFIPLASVAGGIVSAREVKFWRRSRAKYRLPENLGILNTAHFYQLIDLN